MAVVTPFGVEEGATVNVTPMRGKATTIIGTALLLALPLTGCGGDDDSDAGATTSTTSTTDGAGGGAPSRLEVDAKDSLKFDADEYEAKAGDIEFLYKNDGNIVHTLLIEDVDGFKLTVSGRGDEDDGSVELEAGTYTLYCDIAGHRDGGMEATLEVTDSDS